MTMTRKKNAVCLCLFTRKLYISAHSAVETQSFYRAMGCVEAEAYCAEHVEREPFDCQLECAITQYDDTGPDQICCSR